MLRLRDLSQFPSFYSNRQRSIRQTIVNVSKVDKGEGFTEILGASKDYNPTIRILGDKIAQNASVQISCNCKSFQFEFAHAVYKDGTLLNPQQFKKEVLDKPLKKNAYLIPSGCKHIIALQNLFMRNISKFT